MAMTNGVEYAQNRTASTSETLQETLNRVRQCIQNCHAHLGSMEGVPPTPKDQIGPAIDDGIFSTALSALQLADQLEQRTRDLASRVGRL